MESQFHLLDKSKIKSDLKDFYIEYNENLILPEKSKLGLEIEFKIPSYKTTFVDFLTNNLNEDINELSQYIDSFLRNIGYKFPWNVTYEINEHLEIISPILTGKQKNGKC
jgi:hypothetical protein